MRMPQWFTDRLYDKALGIIASRPVDVNIGPANDPYMQRWFIIPRNRIFNIYLHHFRHDDERVLHSHPWWSVSFVVWGWMREYYTPTHDDAADPEKHLFRAVRAGDVVFRDGNIFHRLELATPRALTIFITGPKYQSWYFACKKRLIHWSDYVSTRDRYVPGAGCGEDDGIHSDPRPAQVVHGRGTECTCREQKPACDCAGK